MIVRQVEDTIPGIEMSLDSFEGTSGQVGGDVESHRGAVNITFAPFAKREIPGASALLELQAALSRIITGAHVLVRASDSGPPSGDDVSYEIIGDDYEVIGNITEQMMSILTPYSDDFKIIENDYEANLPEVVVTVDRKLAAHYGLNTVQVASTVRTAITGSKIGVFRDDDEEYDINLRYRDDTRNSLQMLRSISIVAPDGRRVPLSMVAKIQPQSSVSVINRRNLNRAVNVSANFHPGNEKRSEIMAAITAEVEGLEAELPAGYNIGTGAGGRYPW